MCYAKVTMATKPPIASSLNPNAPVFVPAAYLAAEDFSPEWWRLIQTSTSFREWWMKERFVSDENEQAAVAATAARDGNEFDDIDELLELGFQTGILDDLEDQPSPVAPQQQYRQYPQQQQSPQLPLLPNEHVNLLVTPPYSHQKLRSPQAAGGAGFQNGTAFKEGKPQ